MGCLCLGEMQGDVLGGEELLEEGLDEAEAESDPAQVPGVAALLLHGVVLDVLVEDVAQGAVRLARADEVVHLGGWMIEYSVFRRENAVTFLDGTIPHGQ